MKPAATVRAQDGYSMLAVMLVMLATAMFVAAGFAAANGDLPVSRNSQDRKEAYGAAESGVNYYQFKLNADHDFWSRCLPTDPADPAPINQPPGATTAPRKWRSMPGSPAQYSVDLVPATGYTTCQAGVNASMIDPFTGTFRIRVTGRPSQSSTVRRTVNATFRRVGFLDFLYFTDYETLDPIAYVPTGSGDACANKYRPQRTGLGCAEIQFASFDEVKGPFHTNDDILTCGSPKFGRGTQDKIEVSGPAPGYKADGGCATTPVFNGPFRAAATRMPMPPSNAALERVAQSNYLFEGKTTIRFNADNTLTVTNAFRGTATMAPPANGVIYVKNRNCTGTMSPIQARYTEGNGCAQVYVSGTYATSMTIGSQNDIIIRAPDNTDNGDLIRANDNAVLGLVANNFVRVAHPVSTTTGCPNVTTGAHRTMTNVRIDAAILSLTHSFLVDNWRCGAKLGTLTVNGAIAQKYRGPVGSVISGVPHGYEKDYNYDDRLRHRSPPYFLDPVASSWRVIRTNEQIPALQ